MGVRVNAAEVYNHLDISVEYQKDARRLCARKYRAGILDLEELRMILAMLGITRITPKEKK